MATEFISNSWLMPENSNQDKLANYSLTFDGTGDYIDCGNDSSLNITSNITLSAWVKPTTAITSQNFPMFIAKGINSDYMLFANSGTGTARLRLGSSFLIDSVSTISTDVWTHIVGTYDGSNLKIYLNGSLDNTVAQSGAIPSTSGSLQIGAANTGNKFTGNITEASIFDYALTAPQITQLYGTGSAVGNPMSLSTKPVAYYPLGRSPFNGEFLATNKATELFENYALDFDGTDDHISVSSVSLGTTQSISFWIKRDSTSSQSVPIGDTASGWVGIRVYMNGTTLYLRVGTTIVNFGSILTDTSNWTHICITRNAGSTSVYLNGSFNNTQSISDSTASISVDSIGGNTVYNKYVSGMMSNVSLFTSELTSTQVTTLYNSGKPSNLSTFAVTPVSWWRLGSVNSSYNSTTSEWTILDEIGTSNGTGSNLGPAQTALVDGVGATGNGVSSGMSSGTNRSDAPYSSNNAVSYNMSVTAKSTSTPT